MSIYLNLQSVLDRLSLDKMNPTAEESGSYLKKVQFPKISSTSIDLFKKLTKEEFSFPVFAGKLMAAQREIKANLQQHNQKTGTFLATTAAFAAVALYVDLIAVEILGIFRWPTALFLNVPCSVWGMGKLSELNKPRESVRHKTFDAAIQALVSYRAYFTGSNYEEMKTKIVSKLAEESQKNTGLYKRALKELEEANCFCK